MTELSLVIVFSAGSAATVLVNLCLLAFNLKLYTEILKAQAQGRSRG